MADGCSFFSPITTASLSIDPTASALRQITTIKHNPKTTTIGNLVE